MEKKTSAIRRNFESGFKDGNGIIFFLSGRRQVTYWIDPVEISGKQIHRPWKAAKKRRTIEENASRSARVQRAAFPIFCRCQKRKTTRFILYYFRSNILRVEHRILLRFHTWNAFFSTTFPVVTSLLGLFLITSSRGLKEGPLQQLLNSGAVLRTELKSLTEFYLVLLAFTKFYRVLPSFTGFYWVSMSFTGFYRVLPSFTVFYCVLLCFTVFYCVLLCFTGFLWEHKEATGYESIRDFRQ